MIVMLIWFSLITAKKILNGCHVGAAGNFHEKLPYALSKDSFLIDARNECTEAT